MWTTRDLQLYAFSDRDLRTRPSHRKQEGVGDVLKDGENSPQHPLTSFNILETPLKRLMRTFKAKVATDSENIRMM